MFETPRLVLAPELASETELRPFEEGEDRPYFFAPGFVALRFLGPVIYGRPATFGEEDLASLVYLDGPPQPHCDEGFFLYRIVDSVVERLAAWTPVERREAAVRLAAELVRFGQPGSLEQIAAGLEDLADLAREAEESGRRIYVDVLVR